MLDTREDIVSSVVSFTGMGLDTLHARATAPPPAGPAAVAAAAAAGAPEWTSTFTEKGTSCLLELRRAQNTGVWVALAAPDAAHMPTRLVALHTADLFSPLQPLCDVQIGDDKRKEVFVSAAMAHVDAVTRAHLYAVGDRAEANSKSTTAVSGDSYHLRRQQPLQRTVYAVDRPAAAVAVDPRPRPHRRLTAKRPLHVPVASRRSNGDRGGDGSAQSTRVVLGQLLARTQTRPQDAVYQPATEQQQRNNHSSSAQQALSPRQDGAHVRWGGAEVAPVASARTPGTAKRTAGSAGTRLLLAFFDSLCCLLGDCARGLRVFFAKLI